MNKLFLHFQLITADDVQGAVGQHGVDVEEGSFLSFRAPLGQQVAHDTTLLVEDVHKVVQDLKVEGRGEESAPDAPLVTLGHQKAVLQPGVVPVVIHSLVQNLLALQNGLCYKRKEVITILSTRLLVTLMLEFALKLLRKNSVFFHVNNRIGTHVKEAEQTCLHIFLGIFLLRNLFSIT